MASENSSSLPHRERVNNLSSIVLDGQEINILSKGPNFAVTQKITSQIILEAKKGVERLAYAKRWQDAKQRSIQARIDSSVSNVTTATTIEPGPSDGDSSGNTVRAADAGVTRADPNATTTTTETDAAPAGNAMRTSGTGATTRAPETDTGAAGGTGPSSQTTTTVSDKPFSSFRTGLSFRFPDTDKRLPPPTNVEMERKLKHLKEDIVKSYSSHNVTKSNVSREQLNFVDELKKNKDVVVKQSDKCKGLVILDKSDYVDKSRTILNDRRNYEMLDKNPVPKVEAESKRLFKAVTKDKLPDGTVKELTPSHSRIPVFYGLPKDHKEGVPLRPVISACGGPTEKMSCLLERILKQLLKYVPTHLWDTGDFLSKLGKHSQEQGIPKDSIFFSIDVINLYGSIPISEAIDAVCDTLGAHLQEVDTYGLTADDVRSLLEHSLQKNVFSFDNEFYRQTLGIAMGNPCAPPIAILFLDRLERRAVEGAAVRPPFLVRYIDDYAGIWTHGEESLLDFLAYLNSLHPTVKFTLDHSGGGLGVPFLDTLVTVEERNGVTRIETELYIKPTNSGIILHYESAHPTSTKHNIARNQFRRAIRNSSNTLKESRSIAKIRSLLVKNGYPEKLLKRLLREARRNYTPARAKSGKKQQKNCDGFLSLPYIDEELLCKIKSKVTKSGLNVKIAWKNPQKLKDKLVSSALCKPRCPGGQRCHTCRSGFTGDCTQGNVVYELSCNICKGNGQELKYIGETKRPVRLRFNEHRRDALHETQDTPMGDHFRETHSASSSSDSIPLKIRILYKSKDHPDRKIAESLLIQKNHPQLNSNLASWPIL